MVKSGGEEGDDDGGGGGGVVSDDGAGFSSADDFRLRALPHDVHRLVRNVEACLAERVAQQWLLGNIQREALVNVSRIHGTSSPSASNPTRVSIRHQSEHHYVMNPNTFPSSQLSRTHKQRTVHSPPYFEAAHGSETSSCRFFLSCDDRTFLNRETSGSPSQITLDETTNYGSFAAEELSILLAENHAVVSSRSHAVCVSSTEAHLTLLEFAPLSNKTWVVTSVTLQSDMSRKACSVVVSFNDLNSACATGKFALSAISTAIVSEACPLRDPSASRPLRQGSKGSSGGHGIAMLVNAPWSSWANRLSGWTADWVFRTVVVHLIGAGTVAGRCHTETLWELRRITWESTALESLPPRPPVASETAALSTLAQSVAEIRPARDTVDVKKRAFEGAGGLVDDDAQERKSVRPKRVDDVEKTEEEGSPRRPHAENEEQPEDENLCYICNVSFTKRSNLNRHVATVHRRQRPHVCLECGANFASQSNLKRHVAGKHDTIRPFQCSECEQSFLQNSDLRRHMKRRHSEKPKAEGAASGDDTSSRELPNKVK